MVVRGARADGEKKDCQIALKRRFVDVVSSSRVRVDTSVNHVERDAQTSDECVGT